MILLVTGGSASGKSEYAENRALQLAKTEQKKLIYLAAMKPFGEEAGTNLLPLFLSVSFVCPTAFFSCPKGKKCVLRKYVPNLAVFGDTKRSGTRAPLR